MDWESQLLSALPNTKHCEAIVDTRQCILVLSESIPAFSPDLSPTYEQTVFVHIVHSLIPKNRLNADRFLVGVEYREQTNRQTLSL